MFDQEARRWLGMGGDESQRRGRPARSTVAPTGPRGMTVALLLSFSTKAISWPCFELLL